MVYLAQLISSYSHCDTRNFACGFFYVDFRPRARAEPRGMGIKRAADERSSASTEQNY